MIREKLHHYVIVREDLPVGVQFAQAIHAAGESCDGPLPDGTYAYGLGVKNEDHLDVVAAKLWEAEIAHTIIRELDEPYFGEAMAIGIWPTSDKDKIKKVLSDLPLLGKKK